MGRGRAKAKQQKVARQLKYQTGGTSIEDLRDELGADASPTVSAEDAENGFHYPSGEEDEEGEETRSPDESAWGYGSDVDEDGEEAPPSSQREESRRG